MANQLFTTLDQLENYRADKYTINLMDVQTECGLLANCILPSVPGIYRWDMQLPIIKQGDKIYVLKDDKVLEYRYLDSEDDTPCLQFEDLMEDGINVYSEDRRELIPKAKKHIKLQIFKKRPVISPNIVTAVASMVTSILEAETLKSCIPDAVHKLADVLRVKCPDNDKLLAMAEELLVKDNYTAKRRTEITVDSIRDRAESLRDEYHILLNKLEEEFECTIGTGLRDFVADSRYSRYHFDTEGVFFIVERGVDFRLYEYEKARLESVAEIEDETGAKVKSKPESVFSAEYDLF